MLKRFKRVVVIGSYCCYELFGVKHFNKVSLSFLSLTLGSSIDCPPPPATRSCPAPCHTHRCTCHWTAAASLTLPHCHALAASNADDVTLLLLLPRCCYAHILRSYHAVTLPRRCCRAKPRTPQHHTAAAPTMLLPHAAAATLLHATLPAPANASPCRTADATPPRRHTAGATTAAATSTTTRRPR